MKRSVSALVKPYNDIIFKKCFYNPYFSGLIACGGSILPFLSREIYWYQYDEAKPYCIDVAEYQVGRSPLEIAKEQEIVLIQQDNIGDLQSVIDGGGLVLAPIDRYLWSDLKVNNHFYMSTHMSHYMLVYGYESSLYNVIDLDIARNQCYEYSVDEKEFMACYESSMREFPHLHSYIFPTQVSKVKPVDVEACRNDFAINYQSNYEKMVEGLDGYKQVIKKYKNFDISLYEQANIHPVFNVPNDYSTLIRIKKIQMYQMEQLCLADADIWGLQKECITYLELLKNSNWRMLLNRKHEKATIDNIVNKLMQVHEKELEFYNRLYTILRVKSF